MEAKISLTSDMMQKARDYIPLMEKEAWVAENAPKCFDELAITADNEPMPPMYMVNAGLKCRYLMAALVKLYFGIEFQQDPEDAWLMSVDEYDAWAGGHIFNQIERMKHDNCWKFKAYDLMFDYKDLEKRFSTQISGLLTVQNDSVIRQQEIMSNSVKELPALLEQLKTLQGEKNNAAE